MRPASFGRGTAATCAHPRRNGSTGGTQEEITMKQPMTSLPTRLEAGGVCIQAQDWSGLNVARIRFPRGANATPLLEGLPNDLCQCPHWGTVLSGSIHVRYADGSEEIVRAGDVYYWPPGHTVWVDEDYEAVEFSPSEPMCRVIDHLKSKLST
jgi:hypothetical protein